ncbi:hypothetical protein BB559_004889 [Furculomyces boomerangus]|uniref:DDE Tnp4 domain-containing protein n=2 Tax=Harpellales TaxID=61421 RepID=A0A2T9Y669_9FUNG|nr:hypothetical protein BB559_005856 [Furculomyces boomerangus]PVU89871.1 hypothetical protein BB559_004889 [Furculomyces boomerangus]PVZ96582.1 hypothetical protein BB558_007499 [Smittium angustum]
MEEESHYSKQKESSRKLTPSNPSSPDPPQLHNQRKNYQIQHQRNYSNLDYPSKSIQYNQNSPSFTDSHHTLEYRPIQSSQSQHPRYQYNYQPQSNELVNQQSYSGQKQYSFQYRSEQKQNIKEHYHYQPYMQTHQTSHQPHLYSFPGSHKSLSPSLISQPIGPSLISKIDKIRPASEQLTSTHKKKWKHWEPKEKTSKKVEKTERPNRSFQDDIWNLPEQEFMKKIRMRKSTFEFVENLIKKDSVFLNDSKNSQVDVRFQLFVTLYRLGSGGKHTAISRIAKEAGIANGTVSLYTERVLKALNNYAKSYICWPNLEEKKKISEGFKELYNIDGCIGVLSPVQIFFTQRPATSTKDYITNSGKYGVSSLVICDSGYYIRYLNQCYPGSKVSEKMWLSSPMYINPEWYFDKNQFIISKEYIGPGKNIKNLQNIVSKSPKTLESTTIESTSDNKSSIMKDILDSQSTSKRIDEQSTTYISNKGSEKSRDINTEEKNCSLDYAIDKRSGKARDDGRYTKELEEIKQFKNFERVVEITTKTIKLWKTRWGSLMSMKKQLKKPEDFQKVESWITATAVLHNIVIEFEETWEEDS